MDCGRLDEQDSAYFVSSCLDCGSARLEVIREFYRAVDVVLSVDVYSSVEDAAEELGLDVSKVLDLCEKGLIGSRLDETLDGQPLRFIFESDLERFRKSGPNKVMTFDQAMALSFSERWVRRAAWPVEAHLRYCRGSNTDGTEISSADIEFWEDDETFEAYEPSREDKLATDWYEYFPR
jgi:hypothetical protein